MNDKLSDYQKTLVTEHLNVIDKVLNKEMMFSDKDPDFDYEDLYQIGAIGLCKAARSYHSDSESSFSTFSYEVVKNELIDYYRKNKLDKKINIQYLNDSKLEIKRDTGHVIEKEVLDKYYLQALSATKGEYKGITRLGIEALELRLQGYSAGDIAKARNVKPSYITSCISRARKKLKVDAAFLNRIF